MKKNKTLKPRYSGDNSRKFWKRVNSLKRHKNWDAAYSMGVLLQNLEGSVLKFINERLEKEADDAD